MDAAAATELAETMSEAINCLAALASAPNVTQMISTHGVEAWERCALGAVNQCRVLVRLVEANAPETFDTAAIVAALEAIELAALAIDIPTQRAEITANAREALRIMGYPPPPGGWDMLGVNPYPLGEG